MRQNSNQRRRHGLSSGQLAVIFILGVMLLALGYLAGVQASKKSEEVKNTAGNGTMSDEDIAAERERIQEIANYQEFRKQNSTPSPDGQSFGWTSRDQAPHRGGTVPTGSNTVASNTNNNGGAPTQPAPQQPSRPLPIALEPAHLDFGDVAPHSKLTGEILVRNTSDEPITILKTASSCTCTAVDLSNTVIPAGEAVPMSVAFESSSRLGTKSAGVRIILEGYENQLAEAKVSANVQLAVAAIPSYISTIESPAGVTTIRSTDGQAFNLLAVNGKAPNYVGFDPAKDDPRSEYLIAWDYTEVDRSNCRWPDGEKVRPFIVVETDHPDCPVLDIQVRDDCTVVQPPKNGRLWILGGRRELIGELRPGESYDFTLTMRWLPSAQPNDQIYQATTTTPNFKVEVLEVTPTADGATVDLRVTLTEYHPGGLIYENIWIHARNHYAPYLLTGRAAKD